MNLWRQTKKTRKNSAKMHKWYGVTLAFVKLNICIMKVCRTMANASSFSFDVGICLWRGASCTTPQLFNYGAFRAELAKYTNVHCVRLFCTVWFAPELTTSRAQNRQTDVGQRKKRFVFVMQNRDALKWLCVLTGEEFGFSSHVVTCFRVQNQKKIANKWQREREKRGEGGKKRW